MADAEHEPEPPPPPAADTRPSPPAGHRVRISRPERVSERAPVGHAPVLRPFEGGPAAPDPSPPPAHPEPEPHAETLVRSDSDFREVRQGSRPGDTYVRVFTTTVASDRPFRRRPGGVLEATREATIPKEGVGRRVAAVRRFLVGSPIASAAAAHERLTKLKALAVFSSDALSSVAYATQEILLVLLFAGTATLSYLLPVSLAIVALLFIVTFSYRQTIRAYPNGGGSYIVAKDNLGELPGLVAGASLMIDYVLTVAVSISAGVAALTSAFHGLEPLTVELAVVAVIIMVLGNLRGVRESGSIFAAPTYLFLLAILTMIAVGFARALTGGESLLAAQSEPTLPPATAGLGLFLLLRAFSSGSTALTGVEAISNGVPAFKAPEWKNASTTLLWMAGFLAVMFLGISVLAHHYGIVFFDETAVSAAEAAGKEVPRRYQETVLSQIAQTVFGGKNAFYLVVQLSTMLILVLAANTSFADFPRLASLLAKDRYLPHAFTFRGDRLAFSNGILVLGGLAALLLLGFGARTERLIPLYAVGVFLSFTLSQAGMVVHWRRLRGPGWRRSIAINGVGACTTGVVTLIVISTKFIHGAWLSIVLTVILIALFRVIIRHYRQVEEQMRLPDLSAPLQVSTTPQTVIVPVTDLDRSTVEALSYARSISPHVTAVHITDDLDTVEHLRERWETWAGGLPLAIIESPFRSFNGPLLRYLDELQRRDPGARITVVLPEYVPRHLWENLLHNQTALRLKAVLLFRPNTVVIDVPYHLGRT